METKKSPFKRLVFIGLLIGLLVGTALSYYMFPRIVTREKDVVKEKRIVDTVFVEKVKVVYKTKYIIAPQKDSLQDSLPQKEDTALQEVAIEDTASIAVVDTAAQKVKSSISGEGDIVVAQDELLETRYIIPEGDAGNYYCNPDMNLDSLLVDNYTKKANHEGIKVEFWRSPVNVVGYILDRTKLVLYGFYEFDKLGLKYMEDGSIQMTYLNNVYKLECGKDFQSLLIKKESDAD